MQCLLLPLVFIGLLDIQAPPRKPHPLAPSLPQLTPEEEERIEGIIQRFIQFDIGQLQGAEAQKAQAEFQKLGPEAFFALVRGMNQAAKLEASCPAVVISKKLFGILRTTQDLALLQFAQENIGAGVGRSPHGGVLRELRMVALLRQRDVAEGASGSRSDPSEGKIVIRPRQPGDTSIGGRSTLELAQLARTATGDKLKAILTELAKRNSETAISALAAASHPDQDSEIRYLAQELLLKNLNQQPSDTLKAKLQDARVEVRTAAIWAVAARKLPFGEELIELLQDRDLDVGQAARQALIRLAGGATDFGPERSATPQERAEAIRQWRDWWVRQRGQ